MITSYADTAKMADISIGQSLFRVVFGDDDQPEVFHVRVKDKRGSWLTLLLPDGSCLKEQGCRWYRTPDDAIFGEVSLAAHIHVTGQIQNALDRLIRTAWMLNR